MQPLDPLAVPLEGVRLLEASAGTGKTWTIAALYLRLLLERGLEVPEILVVTFTQAATEELRERIRGRVRESSMSGAGAASTSRNSPRMPRLPSAWNPTSRSRWRREIACGAAVLV